MKIEIGNRENLQSNLQTFYLPISIFTFPLSSLLAFAAFALFLDRGTYDHKKLFTGKLTGPGAGERGAAGDGGPSKQSRNTEYKTVRLRGPLAGWGPGN